MLISSSHCLSGGNNFFTANTNLVNAVLCWLRFSIAFRRHRDTNSFGDRCEVPDEAWIPEEQRLSTCRLAGQRKQSGTWDSANSRSSDGKLNSVCGFEEILESIELQQASIGSHLRKPRAGLHFEEGVLGFVGGPMRVGRLIRSSWTPDEGP